VFDQAEPLADGTVSLAKFLQACDPEQAAQVCLPDIVLSERVERVELGQAHSVVRFGGIV
jgi:hypothetical protein